MGQVWRATDTTLGRQVAIKILPDAFASDPERLARFEREAKTLAALNHPHIAQIYGFEKVDVASGFSRTSALVMELVEGEDLSQRLARGAIPLDEGLPIAKQIAEALEAAHEQGIIHRDLKPANIKVRADGTVKVLDFGLAKAMGPSEGDGFSRRQAEAEASALQTITTPAMTQAGMILGTAAYMAPEQAKGQPLDRRADVWAFGAVLFEMLTGQRAFSGEDTTDTIVAVISKEPQWSALPPGTPATIRKLLRRCLEKDRKRRLDSAADARLEVDDAMTAPASGDTAPPIRNHALPWAVAATAVLVAGVLLLLWAPWRTAPGLPPPLETRLDIITPATADPISIALSPDGRQIAFVALGDGTSQLWLRSLGATIAKPLAGTEGAALPFWSPDSRSLGFFAGGELKRLDIGGGTPQTLATVGNPRGGTWNAEGTILFPPTTGGPVFRVPATGGPATAVTTLDRQSSHRFPSFLPDGRHFLFLAQGAADTAGIYLGALDSADTRRLTPAGSAGVYVSGWLLWVRAGTLVAQRLDLERQTLTGDPLTIADPVGVDPTFGTAAVSVSATGLVAYRAGGSSRHQLSWFDRSGKALGTLGAPDENGLSYPHVSPDGHRVVVQRTVQGNADIWLLDGTRTSRLTFDAALDRFPIWSPDGSRIMFDSNRKGHRDLYQQSASSAGAEELFLESVQDKLPTDWSADGRFLLYQSTGPQTDRDIWVVPSDGVRTPRVFLGTNFSERQGAFSPDGRWVAYMSNESGRDEIYIRPFAGPSASGASASTGGQWQVSTAGGIFPRWRPDGKELYYLDPIARMMAAPIVATGATLTPGAPAALFPTRIFGGGVDNARGRQYDVTRDGRFLINTLLDDATTPITLLQNWQPEAKK